MSRMVRMPPASPCVARCTIDEDSQLCVGCARSLDEIAVWGSASDAFRSEVWRDLPARASRLGLGSRRLPWQGDEILAETANRVGSEDAVLVAGVWGASGEFRAPPNETIEVRIDGGILHMSLPGAALRLRGERYLTAFEITRPEAPNVIALAVPQSRAFRTPNAKLCALGPVEDPLLPELKGGPVFDLGLGRKSSRFSVRCDAITAQTLSTTATPTWPDHLAQTGLALRNANPVRIIETPCLRMEIATPIPEVLGVSPAGPHTHLLPDHVAQGLDTPPTVPMPTGFVATALLFTGQTS